MDNDQNFQFRDGSCDGSVFSDNVCLLSSCGAMGLMNNLMRAARALVAILQLKNNKKQSSQTAQWRAAAPDT